jgi:serine protease
MNACGSSIFCFNSGTSMATPVVSGVIGLMLSKNPSLTPSTIESKIKQTANYTSDSQRMKRINAYEAVKAAG